MTKNKDFDRMNSILNPHEHDVLSGRGNFVNYHPGNEHFRALVRKHKVAYVACPKPQKGKFSRLIYDEIRALNPPGRFLKQDAATKLWYDIGEKKALDKTRQALREGAPEIMKELTGDEDDPADDDSISVSPQQNPPNTIAMAPDQIATPPISHASLGVNGFSTMNGTTQHRFDNFNPLGSTSVSTTSLRNDSPPQGFGMQNSVSLSQHFSQQHNNISNAMMHAAQLMGGHAPQHVSQCMPMSHPGMPMSQQPHMSQPRMSRHISPPTGMNLQGQGINSLIQGNDNCINSLQSKLANLPQHHAYEPQPVGLYVNRSNNEDECDPVGPLPSKRGPQRGMEQRGMERQGSEKSLQVDSIFSNASSSNSKSVGDDTNARNNNSSAHLSVMSLSISDMQSHDSNDGITPNDLAPMLNSSLRVGERKSSRPVASLRRNVSGDGNKCDLGHVMDISVATLGGLSDFGEGSVTKMSDSQADMSFSNVFEETEREMLV